MKKERNITTRTILVQCAIALMFALPFERIPTFDLGEVTIRLSSLLLLGVLFVIARNWRELKSRFSKYVDTDRALGAYLIVVLLSGAAGVSPLRTIKVSLFLGVTILGYLLISHFLLSRAARAKGKYYLYLSTAFVVGIGLYQYAANSFFGLGYEWTLLTQNYVRDVLGFARVQSVSLEPLYFANFLLLPLSLLASDIILAPKGKIGWRKQVLFLLSLVAFVLTVSRGAYLAGIIASLVFAWVSIINRLSFVKLFRLAIYPVVAVAISLMAMQFVPLNNSQAGGDPGNVFVSHSLASADTRDAGVTPRFETYKAAYRAFSHNTISGVGLGNFPLVSSVGKTETNQYPIVNNIYLEVLAETGLMGAVALLWLLITVIKVLWKHRQDVTDPIPVLALAPAFAGLLTQYNFFSTIYILFVWVLVGLIVGKERNV